jgi:hypothetical protein
MNKQVPSETKLDQLKRLCEPMNGESMRTVTRLELEVLVECAELVGSVIEAQCTHAGQSEWLRRRKEVMTTLEAL